MYGQESRKVINVASAVLPGQCWFPGSSCDNMHREAPRAVDFRVFWDPSVGVADRAHGDLSLSPYGGPADGV